MNGKRAKEIRHRAMVKAVTWYHTLIAGPDGATNDEIYSYVVDRDYIKLESTGSVVVSQNTKRRFYLDEKKLWKENYRCLNH